MANQEMMNQIAEGSQRLATSDSRLATVFCVGASHKTSTLYLRESLARYFGKNLNQSLDAIRSSAGSDIRELCLLSTCNRYEIYSTGEPSLGQRLQSYLISGLDNSLKRNFDESIYIFQSHQALRHLFEVASSLDSMVLGESEILSQVKNAYETARTSGYTGSVLNVAFQRALACAKRVRTETKIGEGRLSVASVALGIAKRIFSDFSHVSIAIVGTGAMGNETAKTLLDAKPKSKVFLSRSLERAKQMAELYGGSASVLEELPRLLEVSDVIITHVASDEILLTAQVVSRALSKRSRPLFILDVALPRNVDEKAAKLPNVYLYNIDDLKSIACENYDKRKNEISKANEIIDEEVRSFLARIRPESSDLMRNYNSAAMQDI